MPDITPFWITTVLTAPADPTAGTSGMILATLAGAPTSPFLAVIRHVGVYPTGTPVSEVVNIVTTSGTTPATITSFTRDAKSTGPLTIVAGDEVYAYIGDFLRPVRSERWVDGVQYARTPAGIAAAVAAGEGVVHIPRGSDIDWDTTEIVYNGDDLNIVWDSSVRLNLPTGAVAVRPFRFEGSGLSGTSMALSSNAPEGQGYVVVSGANFDTLVTEGLAVGDYVRVTKTPVDATDGGAVHFVAQVVIMDNPNNRIYLSHPLPRAYNTADSAAVRKTVLGKNNRISGLRAYGNGNTYQVIDGAPDIVNGVVMYSAQANFQATDLYGEDLPEGILYGDGPTPGGLQATGYAYGTRIRGVRGVRIGDGGGTGSGVAIASYNETAMNMSDIELTDCNWGYVGRGLHYCNFSNMVSGGATYRNIKFQHAHRSNMTNITGSSSVNNSGVVVAGDSKYNNLSNIQAHDNAEPGVMLIATGNGVPSHNSFFNIFSDGNNTANILGVGECNVLAGAGCGPNNTFEGGVYGPVVENDVILGNAYGHSYVRSYGAGYDPFDAAHFTAQAGTWTVADADEVITWSIQGKSMHVSGYIITSTVSTTPTDLRFRIPYGRTAAVQSVGFCSLDEAGTSFPAYCITVAADTKIYFAKASGAAFTAAGADATHLRFDITFEIQ